LARAISANSKVFGAQLKKNEYLPDSLQTETYKKELLSRVPAPLI
jgi:hypothetical protein